MKTIKYAGEEFGSLAELHSKHASTGITYSCFATRVKCGWDIETALTKKAGSKKIRTYHVNGVDYKDLKALATAAGLTYDAAVKRRDRGFTDEEIFFGKKKEAGRISPPQSIKMSGRNSKMIGGVLYENLHDAYKKIQPSASYNTVRQRLNYKWTLEQAFELDVKVDGRSNPSKKREYTRSTKQSYIVDGVEYFSIPSLAEAYKLPARLVYNRMRDNKWSAERAVKERSCRNQIPKRDERMESGGENEFPALSIAEICRASTRNLSRSGATSERRSL